MPKLTGNERKANRPYDYQTYGIDHTGRLTHAGPVHARRINAKRAKRIQRKWETWRAQYLRDNPGDYPLRTDYMATVWLCVERYRPEDGNENRQWFRV